MSRIQKKFPEIVVDNAGNFSGVVNGKYNLIKVSKRLLKKCSYLIHVYNSYGYELVMKEKKKDTHNATIGEFLDYAQKVLPSIQERYKGLGELNSGDLHKTTLDLNTAVSIRYTVDDVKKELETFELTHGNSKAAAEGRKKMMKEYKINREDLDN
jgi:DNA gyrase/topoisomerase IV subunit B